MGNPSGLEYGNRAVLGALASCTLQPTHAFLLAHIPWNEDSGDWIKKNASALLAIKNSCGAETFDQIKNMNLAKDAWNALADLHKPPNVDEGRGSGTDAGLRNVKLPSPSEGTDSRHKVFRTQAAWVKVIDGILEVVFIPLRPFGAERLKCIYELKLTHMYAKSVLQYWCKEISTYRDATQLVESGTISAIFQAIKNGTVEIVIEILQANPDTIWCNKTLSRDILSASIKYRQGRILRFVYRLDAGNKAFLSLGDEDGNNMLHLVAKLPDLRHYNNLRPAWIMQQEIKWFQEVSWLLPSGYQAAKNLNGETPFQVFRREHQILTKEADECVKKTLDSYILVPVLIVTIMFAALLTVPGGNNQENGIPILLHRKLFSGFLICDAVSLFFASTSMLAFLVILTSSHDAFYVPRFMPLNWMLAISSLIISIISMILAFTFALTIMLQRKWVAATLIFVLLFPISILVNSSYFIIADAYKWTFRSIIFREMVDGRHLLKRLP
ncbi:hypothetical protein SLEP1_g25182 [Rubroshorea leprosula]|uniref:PGG domain-containing protein n=1 Tax=Rubroshorea leprosula TaxID=152421 RepID=A0AAV5JRU0_9ROSI|nr:hypothetical protein SLEP1_g25182 [Rubroshorea leprosula]